MIVLMCTPIVLHLEYRCQSATVTAVAASGAHRLLRSPIWKTNSAPWVDNGGWATASSQDLAFAMCLRCSHSNGRVAEPRSRTTPATAAASVGSPSDRNGDGKELQGASSVRLQLQVPHI